MSNDNVIFMSDYYSKEYDCSIEAVLELKLYIDRLPEIFARTPLGELDDTILIVQQELNKLISNIHHNLKDFRAHFEHVVEVNESLSVRLRTGRFFKGSPRE